MNKCPECKHNLYSYQGGDWIELVCWKCGHYESNSPAFKESPNLFKNIVRDNPKQFLLNHTQINTQKETRNDGTEPLIAGSVKL